MLLCFLKILKLKDRMMEKQGEREEERGFPSAILSPKGLSNDLYAP